MRMPFVRSALDSATQVARLGCEAIVDLEYQQSYSDSFADLTGWNVVESTAGNVSVSGGVLSIISESTDIGTNGVWRAGGGVAGYIEVSCEITVLVTNGIVIGINAGSALPSTVTDFPNFRSNGAQAILRRNNDNLFYDAAGIAANTQYVVRIYNEKMITAAALGRTKFLKNGVLLMCGENTATPTPTVNTLVALQCCRTGATVKYRNYKEHFGGFATTPQPVTYIADAGAGKKWNNFNLTNLAFDYALSSPNATFKYYYGDDVTPTWSSALTLANLKAVGALTTQYRYAMIQVLQNSDGLVQCPVTEVNATDATEGQAATAGGGAQLGAFETGAWR